jgi:sulfur-oxidizing protein SoxY
MTLISRRHALLLGSALPATLSRAGRAAASQTDDPWPGLVTDVFADRPMQQTETVVSMDVPYRSLDAALTPLTLTLAAPLNDPIDRVTLVIDRNPAPVAAVFRLGAEAGVSRIETRVRVNENTAIHAVAETAGGRLFVTERFVKAAGGCSAPAIKSTDEAMASLGRMKLRQFEAPVAESAPREVQLLIRHPNNSGFQVDQVTHYYIPARFVSDIKLYQGDDLIVAVEGGISLSEDPSLRLTFRHNGAKTFRAEIVDTEQAAFAESWDAVPPGSPGT